MDKYKLGSMGESVAANHIEKAGLLILCRNYRTASGEIDIIARQDNTIIFIEVKTRSSLKFGHPSEAVNFTKRRHIINAARWYLNERKIEDGSFRFDVFEVLFGKQVKVRWIKDAFSADE